MTAVQGEILIEPLGLDLQFRWIWTPGAKIVCRIGVPLEETSQFVVLILLVEIDSLRALDNAKRTQPGSDSARGKFLCLQIRTIVSFAHFLLSPREFWFALFEE